MKTLGYLANDGRIYRTKAEMMAVNIQLALYGAQLNNQDRQEKKVLKANAKRAKALKRRNK